MTHPTVEAIRDAVDTIKYVTAHNPMDDTGMVDVAGELRAAARTITDLARSLESEMPDATIAGDTWQTKVARSARRTYNESAIIATLSDAYGTDGPGDALMWALRDGAAKLSWSWSGLRKTFDRFDRPLTIAAHEIGDGDIDDDGTVPHVGEVWESRITFEPVT